MPTPTSPLPPVPPQLPSQPGLAPPPLDQRWLDQLRRRLNASITSAIITTANGFSSARTLNPFSGQASLTISVTASGLLKGVSGALVPAILGTDYLQSITASLPLTITASPIPNLSLPAATSANSGYLTAADHTLFSSKAAPPAPIFQSVLTGFALTTPPSCSHYYLTATAPLASGSLALPTAPADSTNITFACTHSVTTLTNTANPGQTVQNWPVSLVAGLAVSYIFRASYSTWYRLS